MLWKDICVFHSITSLHQGIFLHLSKKLLPTIVISLHMKEKQSMYHLKSLKEKPLSLRMNSWGRKA